MTDTEIRQVPPQDMAAEQAVLGAMLLSGQVIADVIEVLRPPDFYRPAHQTIYETILRLSGAGQPVDQITVAAELTRTGMLARVGGVGVLIDLAGAVPTVASGSYYARLVADKAVARRLIEACTRTIQRAQSADQSGADIRQLADEAQQAMFDVTGGRTSADCVRLEELIQPTLDEMEMIGSGKGTVGVPTGFYDLDQLTNGLHPGQLIVLGARAGTGKSTLGLDIARHASVVAKLPTAIFSLEMSRSEITMRLLAAEAKVELQTIRTGRLSDDDWARLARRMGEISDAPLFIDDSPTLSMQEIRAKARRLRQREGLRLVVVDYLQLMSSPGRQESRQQEVSDLSRALKLLAKELDLPVIAISQLNRKLEDRADKRPQLSDLRESGSVEQDSDIVILLYREDLYVKESPRAGEADLIVAKHRNGPTATVTLAFQGRFSRFVDMTPPGF